MKVTTRIRVAQRVSRRTCGWVVAASLLGVVTQPTMAVGQTTSSTSSSLAPSKSTILGTTGYKPEGIVLDSAGNIYTANSGSDNVSKITPAGVSTILGTTGDRPYGIVLDSAGNIYTTNVESDNVSKITPTSPTRKSGAPKTTITCKKGTVVKKVIALKPVCPKGYIKLKG